MAVLAGVNSERMDRPGLLTGPGLAMTALATAAFVGVFYRWLYKQAQWSISEPEDWAHAFVIPLISIYLLYRVRQELTRARAEPFWPGLAPLLLGIMSYFFCVVGIKNHMLQGLSMILALFGLTLLLLGPAVMRYAFLPIAYLVFAVKISEQIMIDVTFALQLVASQGAWILLSLVGAPFGLSAEVAGNTLTVISPSGAQYPLNVAEACSGMRMVIAFLALGGAVALIACRQWWQRVALLLLAVPVAVFMNVIRVAVLGGLTLANPNLSQGQAHTLIGTLLLIPGLALFMGVVWVLNRIIRVPDEVAS